MSAQGRVPRSLIDPDRQLAMLATDAELLATAAGATRVDGVVPGCPGLTLGETARHVGSMYRMVVRWLHDGRRPTTWQREPAGEESLGDYVRAGAEALLVELSSHEPAEPAPTWWPAEANYGFWRRRMLHETVVHRYDVQGAAGGPAGPVQDDIALDGIDEVLTLWFGHRLDVLKVTATRNYVVSVRAGGLEWLAGATREGGWTIRPGERRDRRDDRDDRTGELAEDAVIFGAPMQVYLWLWGRRPDQAVNVRGKRDATAQLWALLRLATR